MNHLGYRVLVILISLSAMLSCSKPKGAQDDCGFIQNVYGERVSWKQKLPVRMFLHTSVPAEHESSIRKAAQTWNESYGRTLIVIEENRIGGSHPARDSINIIYFMTAWEQDRASEQGRTSLYWVGDQIQEADMRLNGYNYRFYSTEASTAEYRALGGVNMEALALHEFGHVLGMRHNDESPSVMATYLRSNDDRVLLQSTDNASVKCEY